MRLEDSEAIAFVSWLETQFPAIAGDLLHVANEGGNRGANLAAYHTKRKRMGVRPGVSDYFLALPKLSYHGLWLELKAPEGTIKPEQRAFLERRAALGYAACCCWGWLEARKAALDYLQSHWTADVAVAYQGNRVRPLWAATNSGTAKRTRRDR